MKRQSSSASSTFCFDKTADNFIEKVGVSLVYEESHRNLHLRITIKPIKEIKTLEEYQREGMDFSLRLFDSDDGHEINWETHELTKSMAYGYYVWFAQTVNKKVEFQKEYTLEIKAVGERGLMEIPLR